MRSKFRTIIMFLVITLLTVNFTSENSFGYRQKFASNTMDEKYSVMLDTAVDKIDSLIQSKIKILETAKIFVTNLDKKQVKLPLTELVKANKDILDIYVGYEDGSFVDGTGWVAPKDYIAKKRPWYIQTKAANSLHLSNVYLDVLAREFVLSVGYPLKDSKGKVKGVISGDIYLTNVTDIVKKIDIGNGGDIGYAFLLDSHGLVLSHPDKMLIGTNLTLNVNYEKMFPDVLKNDSGSMKFYSEGQDRTFYYEKVPRTGWTLVIAVQVKN